MPCYTDKCNQALFELFDPAFVYPERSLRGASPQSTPSRPNLGNSGYPLCFDNDPFCFSTNPFLLITIWIAYIWNRHFASSSSSLFCSFLRSFAVRGNSSPYFSTA